jgi:hypothetical protein
VTPEGARDFKALAEKGDFRFGGQKIEARYNRIGYKRYEKPETRVLYIEGPYWFMTEERWIEFFTKACVFELEYIGVIVSGFNKCQIPSSTSHVSSVKFRPKSRTTLTLQISGRPTGARRWSFDFAVSMAKL